MKSYTDLEQSEALAIILPLESADMYYEIADIESSLIKIKIHVYDYTDCGITLGRYIHLLRFEETVKRNKMLYEGKMDEIRKDSIKEDITRLKEVLQKKEDELKKLEK